MSEATWEQRMAAKSVSQLVAAFLRSRDDLTDEMIAAIKAAPPEVSVVEPGTHPWYGEMKPYDPARYYWTPEEAQAADPDALLCCYEPRLDGHWGYRLWRTCGMCDHAHHEGEVWLA